MADSLLSRQDRKISTSLSQHYKINAHFNSALGLADSSLSSLKLVRATRFAGDNPIVNRQRNGQKSRSCVD